MSETSPRTLDELLRLRTFQGMSDEEVEIVIEWRIKNALFDRNFQLQVNEQIELLEIKRDVEIEKARVYEDYVKEQLGVYRGSKK